MLRGIERYNGFSAWRTLKLHYEANVASRHTGMLCGILAPDWQAKIQAGGDFLELVH